MKDDFRTSTRLKGGKFLALLIAGILFMGFSSACVDTKPRITVGKQFPIERAVAIKRHQSTTKDVKELLGEPYRKETRPGQIERWRYYCRTETQNAILLFIEGDVTVKEDELIITFDGKIVESIKRTSDTYNE